MSEQMQLNVSSSAKTNEILGLPDHEIINIEKENSSQSTLTTHRITNIKEDQRLDVFNKVKELQAKGVPIKRIATNLEMSRNTVRSYFAQESLTPRTHPKSTNIDLFNSHIVSRLNTNGYKVKDIIEEIRELGFYGSQTQAYHNINVIDIMRNKIYSSPVRTASKPQILNCFGVFCFNQYS